MTELFANTGRGALPLPSDGSAVLRTGREWRECGTPGFLIQPLLEDEDAGVRTWLMKIEPGAFAGVHSHAEVEQVYVLDGEFYDDDASYGAGDYVVRAAGTEHVSGSREGATVLLAYSRAEHAA
ncbi:hypothetical protein GCM10011494_03450 [Novosphingobium endophyticum]|uniref:ChrR-like cupin domain-containing protein n=1 Tax=Novosphingobium endophyticum TaxID=1955250 RepID=A0A916TP17_9SPHN|nr:cupin domain-containing protein [Novosphingobium endophyticum]GGB88465.1 hypothetical protein GCM10011494_03450 [Novosphingobium endophyticum]